MPYVYDAVHNTIINDEQDADFEDGILKPGHALRVKMTAMDSTQQLIANEYDETDDDTDDGEEFTDQRAMLDFEKARIAAAWRGRIDRRRPSANQRQNLHCQWAQSRDGSSAID